MRYTVIWSDTAEENMAFQWGVGGPREKATIDATVALVDRTLLNDPDLVGEPEPDSDLPARALYLWEPTIDGRRAYILYDIRPEDRIVEVVRASVPVGK